MKSSLRIAVWLLVNGWVAAQPPLQVPTTPPPEPWILIVQQPELYGRPAPDAPSSRTQWRAGRRVRVLESRAGDGGSTRTWHLVADLTPDSSPGLASGWVPDVFLAPPPSIDAAQLRAIGGEPVDRHRGIAPEYEPPDLVAVGPGYEEGVDYRLRADAAAALASMIEAARRDGIRLLVVSAYRSWTRQQENYERRLRESGWDQATVAPPGHSEHQLGTAVDLTDGDARHLLRSSFAETPAGRWLREHAWEYGFALSYTAQNQARTGYAPEPWHYRYWGIGLARTRHRQALGVTE